MTVRQESVRGERRWVVAWHEHGRQRRQFYRSRTDAEAAAELRRGDDGIVMSEIHAHGLTLRTVWESYLAGHRPIEMERGPTLAEVAAECLRAKRAGGRSSRYVDALESALTGFAIGRESARVAMITPREIEDWLATKRSVSRSTFRARLSTLFGFAVRRGYAPENPCDRLEIATIARQRPAILSPDDAEALLAWTATARPKSLAVLVLGMLCGLRPEEATATTWPAVRLNAQDGAHIVVEAQTSKIRQRRIVYPLPVAATWLAHAKALGASLPCTRQNWRRFTRAARERMGWEAWPKDITRHTAASYWVAVEPDIHRVAEALGHSVAILKTHYRALVHRADADRFWAISPQTEARGAKETNE